MKSSDELASSLNEEHSELMQKIVKLGKFINSDDYKKLADMDQRLLIIQENTMFVYADILLQRIDNALGKS